jgi:hypothetical protein
MPSAHGYRWSRMKFWAWMLLNLHFSIFIFQSCGLDVEDPTQPSPPQWVQKSLPEEWPERGIDAHESGGITIEWKIEFSPDVVAYHIYRGIAQTINDSIFDFEFIARIVTFTDSIGTYIDRGAYEMSDYCFYKLKSENSAGQLSEYSDIASYFLLPAINRNSMIPNSASDTLGPSRTLNWVYPVYIGMENYCVTIIGMANELVERAIITPGNYVSGSESWQIPIDTEFNSGGIYRWRIDTGAEYVNERETAGSESQWATFIYIE